MADKPNRASEYTSQQVELVRATCLYVATKLGDLMDDLVIVGGLVPSLLVDQRALPNGAVPHVGTLDLDVGLGLALLNEGSYRTLADRLRDAGFAPDETPEGRATRRAERLGGRPNPLQLRGQSDRRVAIPTQRPLTARKKPPSRKEPPPMTTAHHGRPRSRIPSMPLAALALGVLLLTQAGCYHAVVRAGPRGPYPVVSRTSWNLFWGLTDAEFTLVECPRGVAYAEIWEPWWAFFPVALTAGVLSPQRLNYACADAMFVRDQDDTQPAHHRAQTPPPQRSAPVEAVEESPAAPSPAAPAAKPPKGKTKRR